MDDHLKYEVQESDFWTYSEEGGEEYRSNGNEVEVERGGEWVALEV
jgi:hypothetical protein